MINGFVCGAFDLLHPGHCLLLAECARQCDRLFVGLHTDPSIERPLKNKPIQTTYERYIQLAYHKSVYHVIPYDTELDLENLLSTMDLQKRFLGSDYIDVPATGEAICQVRGIDIVYINRVHGWSSNQLRSKIEIDKHLMRAI
jgi:glycerol-3-phosphate cytidylyltransferase